MTIGTAILNHGQKKGFGGGIILYPWNGKFWISLHKDNKFIWIFEGSFTNNLPL